MLAPVPIPCAGSDELAAENFDEVVRLYQQRIFRVLLALVGDEDAANTLAQDCFVRAFKARGKFRGECSLATWLTRIAVNLAHDYSRNRRLAFWRRLVRADSDNAAGPPDPRVSPEGQACARETVAAVWKSVGRLPARQRAVFVLHFGEDMPLEEISEVLNLRLGTVKSHLSRSLAMLRSKLGNRV